MKYPKVSIAIITYNQEKFLDECIKSCLAQDYKNFEIIIADDCSVDGTKEVILRYAAEYPTLIKPVLAIKNSGISINCNNAWRACSGDWVKTIAGDDKLKSDCLSHFVDQAVDDDGVFDAYFSHMTTFDKSGVLNEVRVNEFFCSLSDEDKFKYFLYKNPLPAPTSFIKKSALKDLNFADEKYVMIEDYPLWLKFFESKRKISFIDYSTVFYRLGFGVTSGADKICNIVFVRSFHSFRIDKIWPRLGVWGFLKKMDDWAYFYQNLIGYKFLANKKGFIYYLMIFLMAPFRVLSLLLLSRNIFSLVIRTTSL